jgi:hypothetical protein
MIEKIILVTHKKPETVIRTNCHGIDTHNNGKDSINANKNIIT